MPAHPTSVAQWWQEKSPSPELRKILLATTLYNTGLSAYLFLFGLFLMEHGFTERTLGFVATSLVLGTMAGTIPIGLLTARFDLRTVMLTCLLLIAPISIARTAFFSLPLQLVLAFVSGIVICGWVVAISPLVAGAVNRNQQPSAFSLLFSVAILSCGAGGFLGGHLPGWFGRLLVGSCVPITLIVMSVLASTAAWPIARLSVRRLAARPIRPNLPSPHLIRFFAASSFYAASIGCFTPFISIFFVTRLGFALGPLGTLFSMLQIVEALAVLTMPFLLRLISLPVGILAAQLAGACSLALLAVSHGGLRAALGVCGYLAAFHMSEPFFQTMLMDRTAPEQRGSASATYFLTTSVAQAGAATVGGLIIGRYGYPVLLLGSIVSIVAAAALFRVTCSAPETTAQWHTASVVEIKVSAS